MASLFKTDIGTILEVTVQDENNVIVNLSAATVKQIKIRKPSGTVSAKTAAFTTDGTDGKIRYVTITGDLDEVGEYTMQAYFEFGSSPRYHTAHVTFIVLGNLS